ncbi:MAG: ABC transporter ATP-binding protein [Caldilineaceae bacterium]
MSGIQNDNLMVQATGLRKSFKRSDGTTIDAVKGVDLEIRRGEIFSLLGPNGAGKTTTISMISGLIPPTAGDAYIGGHSISKEPLAAKKLMGFVPQEIALYPELSARQNLRFFGQMYGMGGKELEQRVDEVLDFIDLADRQKDRIDTYSGGMKRRVNIGVGLLHRPQLVYMDEPTVGIDPQSRRRILDTVKLLRDEQKITVLYTTHLMEEAQELSDRVGIIDHGEIIALGTQDELTQKVGEDDRLEFAIGEQVVPDPVLKQLQTQVEGVSQVLHNSAEALGEGSKRTVPGHITVFAKRGRRALPDVIRILNGAGIDVDAVEVREPDLEAVFLALTGRALRDE